MQNAFIRVFLSLLPRFHLFTYPGMYLALTSLVLDGVCLSMILDEVKQYWLDKASTFV